MAEIKIYDSKKIFVHQVHELAEWVGFESRNKYQILDENKSLVGFAAEQQKGFWGFMNRQAFGHWRTFDIHFFTASRNLALVAHHPFRWFLSRLEIRDHTGGPQGAIQQRFSLFSKKFVVETHSGSVILEVSSPLWKPWSFTFNRKGVKAAELRKKWAGLLSEALTDKDNFEIEFYDSNLSPSERNLLMASSVFVDLLFFERKE